jgi:hypothetical protein
MGLSRRSLLGLGVAGAAVLALGGTGLALQSTVMRTPAAPLRALSPRAFSILAAIVDRICVPGPGMPAPAELQVAEGIDGLLATMDPATVAELEQGLLLFENALTGLLLDGRPRTFTSLAPDEQDAVIAAWRSSRLGLRRKVYKALRGIIAAAYHGNPATYAAVGYPGPPDFRGLMAARELALQQAAPTGLAPSDVLPGGAP